MLEVSDVDNVCVCLKRSGQFSLKRAFIDSSIVCGYRGTTAAQRRNSSGGIPPVKCCHLADRSCTSGAIRRIDHAIVVPLVNKSRTKTTQIRASYY